MFCRASFILFIIVLSSQISNRYVYGQLRRGIPQPTNRALLDLELDQQRAQSNIAENRVTRQAEVSRLEGRLLEIESRLERLAVPSSAGSGLAMLNLFDQLANAQKLPGDSVSSAQSNDKKTGDRNDQANDEWASKRPEMLRLVAEDHILALEIELARAHVDRLKLQDRFRSLQQMQAKGLASKPQLELKELEYKQALLRVERFEKLTVGYRKLLPQPGNNSAGRPATPSPN